MRLLLQSELLELQAAMDVPAQGIVIESRLDQGRGAVASLLDSAGHLEARGYRSGRSAVRSRARDAR